MVQMQMSKEMIVDHPIKLTPSDLPSNDVKIVQIQFGNPI
jgi:hypothetical protein